MHLLGHSERKKVSSPSQERGQNVILREAIYVERVHAWSYIRGKSICSTCGTNTYVLQGV